MTFAAGYISCTATNAFFFRVATNVARWGSRLVALPTKGWIRWLPPPLNGWTQSRDFPAFANKSFREEFRASRKAEMLHLDEEPER